MGVEVKGGGVRGANLYIEINIEKNFSIKKLLAKNLMHVLWKKKLRRTFQYVGNLQVE